MSAAHGLEAWVLGVGVLAPGLPNWPTAAGVLRGEQPYLVSPTVLPEPLLLKAAERRRASRLVKLALAAGLEALGPTGARACELPTVFAASGADGHNCDALCAALASQDRQISPTRFHNSVHNMVAGYWGIATGSMEPAQVLCAYDASFGSGLIESLTLLANGYDRVLFIAYDGEYPWPMHPHRPIPDAAAIALLLGHSAAAASMARLEVRLEDAFPTSLDDDALDGLRRVNPSMRGLPLLQYLARGSTGQVALEYFEPMCTMVDVTACSG